MIQVTQKKIKATAVADITRYSFAEINALRARGLECIAISTGIYGVNGALFQDNAGALYKITARSSALFQLT